MFTGKNVDVLEFDIKMDMGMSFFQTVATASSGISTQGESTDNSKVTSVSVANGTVAKEVPPAKVAGPFEYLDPKFAAAEEPIEKAQPPIEKTKKNIKTPLFLGTTIKDPVVRNKRNPLESAAFNALLTRHAAYENVECSMKIAGNPQLLDESTPTPVEVALGGTGALGDPIPTNTGLQRIFKTPALIKVNVKFPDNNELTGVTDFWYRGFYNLYAITQSFDNGLFTQELQMFSLPVEDDEGTEDKLSSVEEKTTPTAAQLSASVQDSDDAGLVVDAYEEPAEVQNFAGNFNLEGSA